MGVQPLLDQLYLSTHVTVRANGVWMSGFDFCASNKVQIHVITAWNPGDERLSGKVNEFRSEQLREDISARGLEPLETLVSDPKSLNAEKGWAVVGMTDNTAIELGRKYGQVAIFFITRARQWVLGCMAEWEIGRVAEDRGLSVVRAKVDDLRSSGEVMSQKIKWNPTNWASEELKVFKSAISKFASKSRSLDGKCYISRRDVIDEDNSVEDVFIGSMIFGFGPVGYGVSRVGKMIHENRNLFLKLNSQYEAAARSVDDSWESHTQKDRVNFLGPAFATKFAYFAARHQKAQGVVPLIADLNTSWAIWWLAEIPRSVELFENYKEYVNTAHFWGSRIKDRYGADEIERALFSLGREMNKSARSRDYSASGADRPSGRKLHDETLHRAQD